MTGISCFFFFQAEDGIRDKLVTGVQTCALPISRRLGRALAAAGDVRAVRLRPLAWGMTAALVGTMAANAFYLTMQFYYFYAFAALALTLPGVFATAHTERPKGSGSLSSARRTGTSAS